MSLTRIFYSGGGTVDFQEFVGGLSAFSSRGGREEKLRCKRLLHVFHPLLTSDPVAFKVYDVDRDGFISNGELFLVLKMMVGNNLKVHVCIVAQYSCPNRRSGSTITANRRQDNNGGRPGRGWETQF